MRRAEYGPNAALIAARREAGLSQEALGRAVGVAGTTVHGWERRGAVPRSPRVREAVEDLLRPVWDELSQG